MKKIAAMFSTLSAVLLNIPAYAQTVVPTGERLNIVPYILAAVAVVLIAALGWLTYLSKKNK
ncbi:MAG TPA: hypothetical protein PLG48_05345 [Candidatus Avimonas sp.]|nr:hypothetical protein [Clostridiales bacterium]HPU58915.1 hypothetical protein [Candidatus Avimonas sp.]